jgi:hypothetical protein
MGINWRMAVEDWRKTSAMLSGRDSLLMDAGCMGWFLLASRVVIN